MYSLPGTRWYIAELIEEISFGAFPRKVVHRNSRFIFANSPDEAYEQAVALGNETPLPANVADDQFSRTRFWSLSHLNVVKEDFRPEADSLAAQFVIQRSSTPPAWVPSADPLVNTYSD